MSQSSYIKPFFLIALFACSCGFVKQNQDEVEEKPAVPTGEVWSDNLMVAADTTDSALFIPARMRYFEHYESIRFYVNITENSKKLFPLFEKRIITPEHFDQSWNAEYTPNAYDSTTCYAHDFDFRGKAIFIDGAGFYEQEGETEILLKYSDGLSPFIKCYCFYMKKGEGLIEEQLQDLTKIDTLVACRPMLL